MFDFISMAGDYKKRKVDNFKQGDITVDTCAVTDNPSFPYETAVKHPAYNNSKWVIVEQYKNKEQAKVGHNKWIGIMTAKELQKKLKDVSTCNTVCLLKSLIAKDN